MLFIKRRARRQNADPVLHHEGSGLSGFDPADQLCTDDAEYRDAVTEAIYRMLCETRDRVPFTDWYFTSTPYMRGFQNRTVQGGLFINLLKF